MLAFTSFLCLAVSAFAGPIREGPSLDSRIIGGSAISIASYPYMVSVEYGGSHTCGGSLISEKWVLTAAQCMDYSVSGYTVRAGTSTRGSGGTVYSVANVITHESYSSRTYEYDIALLQIFGVFSYGSNVQPIALTSSSPANGITTFVVGWGGTEAGGTYSSSLHVVSEPIVSSAQCNAYYGGSITENMVCAGYAAGGRGACAGDEGGPLVLGGVQVGIVSQAGCGGTLAPDVYTSVANLRSWIRSNAGL